MIKIISIFVCISILMFTSVNAWNPAENKDFFVDPETGEPNAIIVVGANAAASDVTAAADMAKKIGAMLYYEEETIMKDVVGSWNSGEDFKDDYGDNMEDKDDKGTSNADAILVGDTSGYFNGIPYQKIKSLWWNDKNGNKKLDKNESREEIYVNFIYEWTTIEGEMATIYPIVPSPSIGYKYYGHEYRVVVEGKAQKEVWEDSDSKETYAIYTDPVSIQFLGEEYNILDFGETEEYKDYVLYGTPQLEEEVEFEVGETKEFNEWEIKLDDINLYEHIVKWIITEPDKKTVHKYNPKRAEDTRLVFGIKDKVCDTDETIFALEYLRCGTGPSGNRAIANIYILKDYGIIHSAICIQPCGPEGYQWRLDVIRDVDIEYRDGNPYYIEELYDDYNYNDKTPDFSDHVKENIIALKLMSFADVRSVKFAEGKEKVSLCRFEIPQCGISDYWVNSGDAPVFIELAIDESKDKYHTDLEIKGGFEVTHYAGDIIKTERVGIEIDPMSIVVNDDEVTEMMKASNNLVLVGGPGLVVCVGTEPQICNILTKKLWDDGKSTVDWFHSVGKYEYIADAFAEGKDVIIVAGDDREATRYAVEILLQDLNA